ncbi:GNAT family N-acetyltransferase [Lacinutrix sp. WUR7]|uniref:bifunctional helix-turn-helix transcriptional regulator/GNAT family N-acetyltransferase n=1 Tax=Lacinutrix sp. WUR7 TaxID=2653681 RepID=UPI00193D7977|nr:GNAT family N-acetyltransferase [Lacinutrix sp. WUR7]
MDALQGFGELAIGSRLKRISEFMMKETQLVYNHFNIDFDPYLFPTFKIIVNKKGVTNTEINESLNISQPAVTQALNKLSKKGLIAVSNSKTDKRKKNIQLSKKGENFLIQIIPIWNGIDSIIKEFTMHSSSSLIEHLNKLESKLNAQPLSQLIIDKIKMNTPTQLEIIAYDNIYAKDFYNLNIEWLKKYFVVEPYDEEVLGKPDTYIIAKGGYIFFAKLENEIVGTVALMPIEEEGTFELTKMAVSPAHRGFKIGQKLMQHCLDFAREQEFKRLLLYSSRKLENAIYIYRKYGFIEQPLEKNSPYQRSDIKMEYPL